jgi:RNA polymerase sigma factor (sigma-70 family)
MSDFNIQIKVRNGRLLRAIRARYKSSADMCRKCDISLTILSTYLVMKRNPVGVDGDWKKSAYDISSAVGLEPEEIWPAYMRQVSMRTNTVSLDMTLDQVGELIESGENNLSIKMLAMKLLNTERLTNRYREVLKMRFFDDMTLEEAASEKIVSRERIRQIEAKALRTLRHPASRCGINREDI